MRPATDSSTLRRSAVTPTSKLCGDSSSPTPMAFRQASLRVQQVRKARSRSCAGRAASASCSRRVKCSAASMAASGTGRSSSTSAPSGPRPPTAISARPRLWLSENWVREWPDSEGLPNEPVARCSAAWCRPVYSAQRLAQRDVRRHEALPVRGKPEARGAAALFVRQQLRRQEVGEAVEVDVPAERCVDRQCVGWRCSWSPLAQPAAEGAPAGRRAVLLRGRVGAASSANSDGTPSAAACADEAICPRFSNR
jgi:hypothetical protein